MLWWVLLCVSASVVAATVLLIVLTGTGNWLTVAGSLCTVIASVGALGLRRRALVRERNAPASASSEDSDAV